jgi:KAP family P-loop domain
VYFNAWKYAGFMEIVPSLIYKILREGNYPRRDIGQTIATIMISLGKQYSDRVGEWVEKRIGVDTKEMYKDIDKAIRTLGNDGFVPNAVIEKYYTQIDQAQDLLEEVFSDRGRYTIVLIDELDRCDPDEAFSVIKQLRVFFAMRNLPIIFVLCANPKPIGLAIKHRYGLDTETGEFEWRRILEKFVDTYIDMMEPLQLSSFVQWLWSSQNQNVNKAAALIQIDEDFVISDWNRDTVRNAKSLL